MFSAPIPLSRVELLPIATPLGTQSDITVQTVMIKGTLRKYSQTIASSRRFTVHDKLQRQVVLNGNGTFSHGFTQGRSTKSFTEDTRPFRTSFHLLNGKDLK